MKPRSQALPSLVRAFFEANPDEELTYETACVKFGTNPVTMRNAVYRLTQQGQIESVHVIRRPAKGRAA